MPRRDRDETRLAADHAARASTEHRAGREPYTEVKRSSSLPDLEVWSFYNWMRPGTYCAPLITLTAPSSASVTSIHARYAGRRERGDASNLLVTVPNDIVVVERLSGAQPAPAERTIVGIAVAPELVEQCRRERLRSGLIKAADGRHLGRELNRVAGALELGDMPRCQREELVLQLIDDVLGGSSGAAPARLCARSVEQSREYIHAHFTQPFSLEAMASEVGISKWHLTRAFREKVGLSPGEYARALRVQHALTLVRSGVALRSAAARVGYSDQAHMARELRAISGLTPSRYGGRTPRLAI